MGCAGGWDLSSSTGELVWVDALHDLQQRAADFRCGGGWCGGAVEERRGDAGKGGGGRVEIFCVPRGGECHLQAGCRRHDGRWSPGGPDWTGWNNGGAAAILAVDSAAGWDLL